MTQPEPTDLPAVPAEEVTELEAAAVLATVGGFSALLAPVLAAILAIFETTEGTAPATLREVTTRRLGELAWPSMDAPAEQYGVRAQNMGRERGLSELPRAEQRGAALTAGTGERDRPRLDSAVRSRLDEAVRLARVLPLDTKKNVMAVIGRASSAKALAEGTVRSVVYGGISKGKIAVALATGHNLLWVPERDACLHCLAHAGWVWRPGSRLPKGLTYADKPLPGRVRYPPLHPNCRCEAVLTDLPVGAPSRERSRLDPAARLAAEARRSVVLGWTDHASQAATLRAMDRLLRQGADLPTSVEQRARRAVAAGKLPRRPR